jgi:hypothetical protein
MRKWGIVISVFYAVIVLGLLLPAAIPIGGWGGLFSQEFYGDLRDFYSMGAAWIPIAAVLTGQATLLFLSVDTSFKKLKPRAHIAVSVTVASMLIAMLAVAVIYCLEAAVRGDDFGNSYNLGTPAGMFELWGALWVLWGIVFYLYFRNSSRVTERAVSWLLKGSVLELLIAVPCHVIVRRRHDCSAPVATSFGIVTGIAVMLLCFGPSVLFLFKKRLDGYSAHTSA